MQAPVEMTRDQLRGRCQIRNSFFPFFLEKHDVDSEIPLIGYRNAIPREQYRQPFTRRGQIIRKFILLFVFLVVFGVHEFGDDLSGMAGRVEMVCVYAGLLLGALLAAVTGEDVFVVFEVVVVIFVEE